MAYLMDAIQKQVAPSWFTAVGLRFGFNLLRVRMFSSPERFLLTIAALAAVPLAVGFSGNLQALLAVLGGGLLALNLLRTFSAEPQKLLRQSGGSFWKFAVDLVAFPSLQGKTDVRFQFMRELNEVVEALLPQRLVIFLDDLDRCRPEQVVDILEAINFLSSAAPCFIFVGADYRKVETLAGQHFEAIALEEAENVAHDGHAPAAQANGAQTGGAPPNTVTARMQYARKYMLKIVNMRLDLPRPTPKGIANLIRQPGRTAASHSASWQRYAMGTLFALSLIATVAVATNLAVPPSENSSAATSGVAAAEPSTTAPAATSGGAATTQAPAPTASSTSASTTEATSTEGRMNRNEVGVMWSHWLDLLNPLLVGAIVVVRVRSAPKEMEKAVDSHAFSEALDASAESIQNRCETPREVRRFQNYLRFLPAWDDSGAAPKIPNLEAHLVRLAACGVALWDGTDRRDMPSESIRFFRQQCEMLGLDPNTFRPKEERSVNYAEMPPGAAEPVPVAERVVVAASA